MLRSFLHLKERPCHRVIRTFVNELPGRQLWGRTTSTTRRALIAMEHSEAKLLSLSEEHFNQAGKELRSGNCVAFPTETVYGLGANALSRDAVLKIFEYKGRPLTDPLIVHVSHLEEAFPLLELTEQGRKIFIHLAQSFWPGPLTLISKASSKIPPDVTAHTGFVGIRFPAHPIAQRLLAAAKVPIAAPSANKFGHVSPTSARHVLADLGRCPISIINGEEDGHGTCQVGIESTVAKICDDTNELILFRRGGVSDQALREALDAAGLARIKVISVTRAADTSQSQQAPGGLITHYAPAGLETFILSFDSAEESSEEVKLANESYVASHLAKAVVVDFHGSLAHLKSKVLAYRDLSPQGSVSEAANSLFAVLRWTEEFKGATHVFLADVSRSQHEHTLAVFDRMFRAASGNILAVHSQDKRWR